MSRLACQMLRKCYTSWLGLGKHIVFTPLVRWVWHFTNLGVDRAHKGTNFFLRLLSLWFTLLFFVFFKDKTSKTNLALFVPSKQGLLIHCFMDTCYTDELRIAAIPQGVRQWPEIPTTKSGLEQRQKEAPNKTKHLLSLRSQETYFLATNHFGI